MFRLVMDPFDKRILTVLSDGKPRSFRELVAEVGFSHNTLRLHLEGLVDKGLVLKQKISKKGLGRPMFTYSYLLHSGAIYSASSQNRPQMLCPSTSAG
jgi:predicted ArsR family transcriptional regulator